MQEQDRRAIQKNTIAHNFTYHPPKAGQPERYEKLRAAGRELALLITEETPYSREQSLALTNLEQAIFWANASIARNESGESKGGHTS